jgi:hypothetical protein
MSAPVQHSRHGGMPRRKVGVPQPLSTTAYGTKEPIDVTQGVVGLLGYS